METSYPLRYPGPRWSIIYQSYSGLNQFAVNELQKIVQPFLPYVIQVQDVATAGLSEVENSILIGSCQQTPILQELLSCANLPVPAVSQSYTLACLDNLEGRGRRVLMVAGADPQGVLYGVQELGKRLYAQAEREGSVIRMDPGKLRQLFDNQEPFSLHEQPVVRERGLWTWGYVIRDYRRYIDNMACLKMNTLVVWNDFPPLNSIQLIDYAHARGIQVIFGFHWGWGLSTIDLSNPADSQAVRASVLERYRKEYQGLDLDGIYFQTLTEHTQTNFGERTVASVVCDFVNDTARSLWQINPDLKIYFGLHATSIREHYVDLASLEPQITIVWEDAGSLPYTYRPIAPSQDDFQATLEYSRQLASFRPGTRFALVPKGWSNLNWSYEFEHHGPFILGEQPAWTIRERLHSQNGYWDEINALWRQNFPLAARFYRELAEASPAGMMAVGLVEDGLFEEKIQPSVSLFAEMLWNPFRSDEEILERALVSNYDW